MVDETHVPVVRPYAVAARLAAFLRPLQADNAASPLGYQPGEFWACLNRQHASRVSAPAPPGAG